MRGQTGCGQVDQSRATIPWIHRSLGVTVLLEPRDVVHRGGIGQSKVPAARSRKRRYAWPTAANPPQFLPGETMNSTFCRALALFGTLTLLALAAPAAGATSTLHIDELRLGTLAGRAAASADGRVGVSPAPCEDPAYNLLGGSWLNGLYLWSFQASSTPNNLSATAVRDVLKKSFSNITSVNNDCGTPDNVSATNTYLGNTNARARCNRRDFQNVVGFHQLEFGVLAVTCYWINSGHIVEADIQINSDESWALSKASCVDEIMLEATITHEAGHVFGLDHVGERRHGRLTMSPFLDGPCRNAEATLGEGDILGLEHLY